MIIRDFFLIREKMMVLAKCRTGTAEKAMVQKFFCSQFSRLFFNLLLCHKVFSFCFLISASLYKTFSCLVQHVLAMEPP